jgi:hypothetical protein
MYAAYKDADEFEISAYECKACDKEADRKHEAGLWLKDALEQLYSHKDLDRGKLEQSLDELCYYFDMKPCAGDLMIERFSEIHYEWKPKIPGV